MGKSMGKAWKLIGKTWEKGGKSVEKVWKSVNSFWKRRGKAWRRKKVEKKTAQHFTFLYCSTLALTILLLASPHCPCERGSG